jgi:D-aminoacyl-tRNA deacylase
MVRLLVCSEKDLPSVNMRSKLMGKRDWDDMGSNDFGTFLSNGDMVIMSIPGLHINAENIDAAAEDFGIHVDDIVFMSRHSAASGMPTLTVHPIGNYEGADYGGRARTLVVPNPHLMTDSLRRIKELNDTDLFNVSFEVTHHGPFVGKPTMFIEIGSNDEHWGDTHAADILSDVILSAEGHNDYPVAIGVGGGHYAPRFTELALSHKIDFGHMVPAYQTTDASDDDVTRMIKDAASVTGTKLVYIHRKSMKGPEERRVSSIIDSLGLERISSKDLDPLDGSV